MKLYFLLLDLILLLSLTFAFCPDETWKALAVEAMASWNAHSSMMACMEETWSYGSVRGRADKFVFVLTRS